MNDARFGGFYYGTSDFARHGTAFEEGGVMPWRFMHMGTKNG